MKISNKKVFCALCKYCDHGTVINWQIRYFCTKKAKYMYANDGCEQGIVNKKRKYAMTKYRKKPVVIDAIQYTGDNKKEIEEFATGKDGRSVSIVNDNLIIHTLEGDMIASIGDFIIRGVDGEYYPCKPYIFEETYEKVW